VVARRVASLGLTALAALAAAALAAAAKLDPLSLALHRTDMPASVAKTLIPSPSRMSASTVAILGVPGTTAAEYSYTWPAGGSVAVPALGATAKEWHLSGTVFVAPDKAGAQTLFAQGRAARHGFFSDFSTLGASKVSLPPLGNEQFGLLGTDAGGSQAMAFVRRGRVVWQMRIGHSPPQWKVTKAQVLTQLHQYTAKQRTRIGSA
jgi:hypothetical protein